MIEIPHSPAVRRRMSQAAAVAAGVALDQFSNAGSRLMGGGDA